MNSCRIVKSRSRQGAGGVWKFGKFTRSLTLAALEAWGIAETGRITYGSIDNRRRDRATYLRRLTPPLCREGRIGEAP